MQPGQPLLLSALLPRGVTADDMYIMFAGVAAFLCVWAIGDSFVERDHMSAKIKAIQERRKSLQTEFRGQSKRRKKPDAGVNFMKATVNKLQLLKSSQRGKIESALIEAGWRSKDAVFILMFFNLVTPVMFAALGFVIMEINFGVDKLAKFDMLWPVAMAYLGFKFPMIVVSRRRKKRYLKVQRSLADVLDLMTICAEAGLSLAASLDRVSRELRISYPEMAEEMGLTAIELGFLPDRNKALLNLSERCKLPEVRGIVSVLIQTEKYGTPIAQAMRVLSAEFRQARMLRAEQKAARLPAIMTVPMIVFILPVLFIVIISPAIIQLLGVVK